MSYPGVAFRDRLLNPLWTGDHLTPTGPETQTPSCSVYCRYDSHRRLGDNVTVPLRRYSRALWAECVAYSFERLLYGYKPSVKSETLEDCSALHTDQVECRKLEMNVEVETT